MRAKFLALREEDFTQAGKYLGTSEMRIIIRHMVPSFSSHLIAVLTLREPVISWDVLLTGVQNIRAVTLALWLFLPGVPIVVTVLRFNFVGDGLRDGRPLFAVADYNGAVVTRPDFISPELSPKVYVRHRETPCSSISYGEANCPADESVDPIKAKEIPNPLPTLRNMVFLKSGTPAPGRSTNRVHECRACTSSCRSTSGWTRHKPPPDIRTKMMVHRRDKQFEPNSSTL